MVSAEESVIRSRKVLMMIGGRCLLMHARVAGVAEYLVH